VRPFKHLKQILYAYQSADLTHFIGNTAGPGKVALITLLQLRVREIHDAS